MRHSDGTTLHLWSATVVSVTVVDGFADSHDGVRIAYRDHGGDGGRDLLLLHGAGVHLLSLTNLVRKLQED